MGINVFNKRHCVYLKHQNIYSWVGKRLSNICEAYRYTSVFKNIYIRFDVFPIFCFVIYGF